MKQSGFPNALRAPAFLVMATLWCGGAQADGIYRCMVDGVPTFTQKAIKGHACKALPPAPPPPSQPYIPDLSPTTGAGQPEVAQAQANPDASAASPAQNPPSTAPRGGLPPLPPVALPDP